MTSEIRTIHRSIVVLEDDEERICAMRQVLDDRLSEFDCTFFDNAPDMIAWLGHHLDSTSLLCLDHDLGPNRRRNDRTFDPGVGQDVVKYLQTCKPSCPVVIHSTNTPAAIGMKAALRKSGWVCSRVIPFDDLNWVNTIWRAKVTRYLGKPRHSASSP
jgi:hypothetical protein